MSELVHGSTGEAWYKRALEAHAEIIRLTEELAAIHAAHGAEVCRDLRMELSAASAEITRLQTELAEASAKLDGALTLGHDCGWNAREILADRCEEKLQSALSAAQAMIAKMTAALGKISDPLLKVAPDAIRPVTSALKLISEMQSIARAALASPAEKVQPERYRHVKRGSFYTIVGESALQTDTPLTDMAELIVYRAEKDGTLWVRSKKEFYDGRFVVAEKEQQS